MNDRADAVHSEIASNFRLHKHVKVFKQLGIRDTEQLAKTPFAKLLSNERFLTEVWNDYADWFFSYLLSLLKCEEVKRV